MLDEIVIYILYRNQAVQEYRVCDFSSYPWGKYIFQKIWIGADITTIKMDAWSLHHHHLPNSKDPIRFPQPEKDLDFGIRGPPIGKIFWQNWI